MNKLCWATTNNCMPIMFQWQMLCSENLDGIMTMNGEDFEQDIYDLLQLCISAFAWNDREHP